MYHTVRSLREPAQVWFNTYIQRHRLLPFCFISSQCASYRHETSVEQMKNRCRAMAYVKFCSPYNFCNFSRSFWAVNNCLNPEMVTFGRTMSNAGQSINKVTSSLRLSLAPKSVFHHLLFIFRAVGREICVVKVACKP